MDKCEDIHKLPNIVFEFKGVGNEDAFFELEIKPEDYVMKFQNGKNTECVVGIAPDIQDDVWTLGQAFMKSFYTMFDRDKKAVGFARVTEKSELDSKKIKYEKAEIIKSKIFSEMSKSKDMKNENSDIKKLFKEFKNETETFFMKME